jgi:hypothetical protein
MTDTRAEWQKRQGAACGCGGADEMCPCQNHNKADDRRRPLSLELIREAVKEAMAGYLRQCSSGGMPSKLARKIQVYVDAAADLDCFAIAIIRRMDPESAERADKEAAHFFANLGREIREMGS